MFVHQGTLKDYCNALGAKKNSENGDELKRAKDPVPFDDRYRIPIESVSSAASYFSTQNKWRRIDTDWL